VGVGVGGGGGAGAWRVLQRCPAHAAQRLRRFRRALRPAPPSGRRRQPLPDPCAGQQAELPCPRAPCARARCLSWARPPSAASPWPTGTSRTAGPTWSTTRWAPVLQEAGGAGGGEVAHTAAQPALLVRSEAPSGGGVGGVGAADAACHPARTLARPAADGRGARPRRRRQLRRLPPRPAPAAADPRPPRPPRRRCPATRCTPRATPAWGTCTARCRCPGRSGSRTAASARVASRCAAARAPPLHWPPAGRPQPALRRPRCNAAGCLWCRLQNQTARPASLPRRA
jgi:hypothetical protein